MGWRKATAGGARSLSTNPPTSTLWRSAARGSHSNEEEHRALDRALSSEAESERFPTSPAT